MCPPEPGPSMVAEANGLAANSSLFTPVMGGSEPDARATKLAQIVAQQIVDDVIGRGWPVDESLGAEPELMARYGVSRAVLREAIRLVEHMGVATMRRGPRGGLIVTSSSVSAVTDAIAIFLETEVVDLDDLAEARVVLELQAVRLAADRLDTPGTEALLRVPMESEGAGSGREAGHPDLHLAIAQATGNPVLLLFIDALGRLERRYLTAGWDEERRARMHVATSLAQAHRAIADAVISGDGLLARHRMLTHLESVARFVRRFGNDPGEDREWPANASVPGGADPPASLVPGVSAVISDGRKLGEVTAARIRQDIARRRAPVGANLGSESVLLAAYGVSRSVLREAVRLLEYHSVARMRRGPGGGLIVVKPDPEAVIRAVALYLQSVKVDSHALYEARDTIELASVAFAVERLEPSGADALREALERERLACEHMGSERIGSERMGSERMGSERMGSERMGSERIGAGRSRAERPRSERIRAGRPGSEARDDQAAANVHAVIAELTGNRILSLFTRILLALTAGSIRSLPDDEWLEVQRQAHEMHTGIVTAILGGDSALARRRARVHLWEMEKLQAPLAGDEATGVLDEEGPVD